MKDFFENIKSLLYRLLLILILFSVTRFYFFVANYLYFSNESFSDIIISFLHGIRFDLSAIFVLNSLFIVFHILPFSFIRSNSFELIKKILFISINSFLLFLNLLDSEYFKFTNKRTTYDIFSLITTGEDFKNLIPAFIKDYWPIIIIWAGLTGILWKFYYRTKFSEIKKIKFSWIIYQFIISFAIVAISFVMWRGTDLRPISILTAAKYSSSHNIPLTLNTPFSVYRTINKMDFQKTDFFSDSVANKYFTPLHTPVKKDSFKNKNVVILILESFSKEYMGYFGNKSYTPFLDSLFRNSLVFTNSFANGKKSMEAVPAIISSIPSLFDNPYITSNYVSNRIQSLATCLKTNGYATSFFHGGTNGTMGFDNFSKVADFDTYYGRTEFNNEKYYDGNWGIFDEEFLKFTVDKFTTFKTPFLSCIFTLSSHHPYQVPEKYKDKFPEGNLEIHKSIMYADYSLSEFFKYASKQTWYNNTVFVITGDHTAQTEQYIYLTYVGRYFVPIALFCPSDTSLTGKSNILMQHIDIMPTILSYLNYDKSYFSFGKNTLQTNLNNYAVTYISGIYQLIDKEYSLLFDGEKSIALYNYIKDPSQSENIIKENKERVKNMETYLKAFIQSYFNNLNNNTIYFESEK